MITIYHKIESDFWTPATDFDPKLFDIVGYVRTEDLDVAYLKTNNIDSSWTLNEEVTMAPRGGCRSSSIGDVFELNGEYFAVAVFGFTKIPLASTTKIINEINKEA